MRILIAFGFLGLSVAIAGVSWAEEPVDPRPATDEAVRGPLPPMLQGELALSTGEAIAMAIENNLKVEVARFTPLIADLDHTGAWGAYDPNLFGNFEYASSQTPVATALLVGTNLSIERKTTGGAGVTGLIPKLGAQYEIAYGGQKLLSNSSIQSLSPEYRANLLGTLTVPLLKGAWWGEPWVAVKQTGIGAEIGDEEFRRELMDILRDTRNAYWEVAATGAQRRVSNKSLEQRRALLDQTEAQYEVGVVSRVEVTQAEAGLAAAEVSVIVDENAYRTAQDVLIQLVLGPKLTPDSQLEIQPTDSPEEIVAYDVDPEEANRKALAHRPEIVSARKSVERQEIELKFRKNQRLPQLDVKFTYGYNGLGGSNNPAPQFGLPLGPVNRSYSTAHEDWFSNRAASQWSGGAVVTIPIGNVSGRAGASRAQLELRRAQTELRQLELGIVIEVREAIRSLNSALEGLEAAERQRVAAEEQLRAESIRLEYGESTPFDVLLKEEVLVDAESSKIAAYKAYHNSVTALERAQGTILRNHNIVVEDAATLR
jgi:outer membrane protein